MYKIVFKRVLDFLLALIALIILSPIFIILIITGAIVMKGNPFFVQPRPGKKDKNGKETIFKLIKFRTMSNEKDKEGKFLPDSIRLNAYGKFLRSTSLDELGELINIIKGDMSIVGPRPQLVRDMVYMTYEQRKRHNVRPGLTGLAQVKGRNNITWEKKIEYDLMYIENIAFIVDIKIIFHTFFKVVKREDVVRSGTVTDIDFGDWLLVNKKITEEEYNNKQLEAKELLNSNAKI